ncbi:hypothetical protein L1887_62627 [Cichorium endivia]|nr:hypothetical protein L1887_62627 [Cichorium endivia]
MLTLEPFSEDQGRSAVHPARGIPPISFLAPCGFTHPLTRTHVRLLGPCFKTGRMGCPQARCREHAGISPRRRVLPTTIDVTASPRAYRQLGLWPPHQSAPVHAPRSIGGPAIAVPHPTGDASPAPIRFPPDNFKHSLTLFSKSFSSFPRGTAPRGATGSGHDGALTLSGAPSRGLGPGPPLEDASPDYNSDSEAVRFSSWADPGSLAVTKGILTNLRPDAMCPDKGCMVGGDAMRDAQAGVPSAGWLWAQLAFKNSMVHGISAIHTKYRILLRSSSMREPRYPLPRVVHVHGSFCFAGFDNDPSAGSPTETLLRLLLPLNDKVQWNSRDVAGGEPPTFPGPVGQGYILVEYISVARVRPRTSKGITDLLLPQTSWPERP